MGRAYSKDRKDLNETGLVQIMRRLGIDVGPGMRTGDGYDRPASFRGRFYMVEIKNPEKFQKGYRKNGENVKFASKMEAAIYNLTESEAKMRDWAIRNKVNYVIVWDFESVKKGFGIM